MTARELVGWFIDPKLMAKYFGVVWGLSFGMMCGLLFLQYVLGYDVTHFFPSCGQ